MWLFTWLGSQQKGINVVFRLQRATEVLELTYPGK